jgi:hypothetical protein
MNKKDPSSNIQAPEKHQAAISNQSTRNFWGLEFEVSLELGCWSLELPPSL